MKPSFREWVVDTFERTVGTAAAAALALLVSSNNDTVDPVSVDWEHGAGLVALASVVTVLKCVAARFKGNPDDGSLRG